MAEYDPKNPDPTKSIGYRVASGFSWFMGLFVFAIILFGFATLMPMEDRPTYGLTVLVIVLSIGAVRILSRLSSHSFAKRIGAPLDIVSDGLEKFWGVLGKIIGRIVQLPFSLIWKVLGKPIKTAGETIDEAAEVVTSLLTFFGGLAILAGGVGLFAFVVIAFPLPVIAITLILILLVMLSR